MEGVGGEEHGAELETSVVGLLAAFGGELDAVVWDCLVDLPVLVAFGLGVTDHDDHLDGEVSSGEYRETDILARGLPISAVLSVGGSGDVINR